MADESQWIDRAQSAEASLTTCRDTQDKIKEKYRAMMSFLGAHEKSDGSIHFDFDVLVKQLSTEHALNLRAIIDEHHRISGAPGEKPKISVASGKKKT